MQIVKGERFGFLCVLISFALQITTAVVGADIGRGGMTGKSLTVPEASNISHSINLFGDKLFVALPENVRGDAKLLSPWGAAHALAMLLEGAAPGSAARTSLEGVVFGVDSSSPEISRNQGLSESIRDISLALIAASNGKELTVEDANSAWVAPGVKLLESYVSYLQQFFEAQASVLENAQVVNDWVTEKTRGKITSIIDDQTAQQADLVLINAIYFKGLWVKQFDVRQTMPSPFHFLDATVRNVPLMYLKVGPDSKNKNAVQGTKFSVPSKDGEEITCMAARLQYQGNGGYAAIFAAPDGRIKEKDGLNELTLENGENYFDYLQVCHRELLKKISSHDSDLKWLSPGDSEADSIHVWVPRFEVESSETLTPSLRDQGLQAIFRPGDFTEISSNNKDLYVSDVVQKVYVKVDEEGSEAAAVTGVIMRTVALQIKPELLLNFNRPFAFFIVHEPTGLVMFAGDIYNPEHS